MGDIGALMQLVHCRKLLEMYSMSGFVSKIRSCFVADASGNGGAKLSRARAQIGTSEEFIALMTLAESYMSCGKAEHPKLKALVNLLLDHFQKTPNSRAIVFCEFQDVVMEITEALQRHRPRIRASHFVGRGGGKGRGMKQKEQLRVLYDFRNDKLNVLVATCIGEEGLDIGEVRFSVRLDRSAIAYATLM